MKASFLTRRAACKYAAALINLGHQITFKRQNGEFIVGIA